MDLLAARVSPEPIRAAGPAFHAAWLDREKTAGAADILDDLALYRTYGGGVLERIPTEPIWRRRLDVV